MSHKRQFKFEQMMSILETIRHYQRSINKSAEDEERLLHCLDKLNRLPMNMKFLQETKVGRTVNDLRKRDGRVGRTATTLVSKWNRQIEAENTGSSDKRERLHTDDTENIKPGTRNNYIKDSQENGARSTLISNSDSRDQMVHNDIPVSCSTDNSPGECQEKFSQSEKKCTKSSDKEGSHQSSCSILRSTSKRESDYYRVKTKNSKRKYDGNDKKRRLESDLIDIDHTMGTSFADALGMLDVPSSSKKLHKDKSLLHRTSILLKKRPELDPPIDNAVEILSSSTVIEPETLKCAFRQPQKQPKTNQPTDEITINITSRKSKTKIFSGNKATLKCKVPTLFAMCIHILQDNIDLLEFTGGVPFDILRPVLERTTSEQLMVLEDFNPYLMEDSHCLWEQHCKRRFRMKNREDLETWRDMYIRCLDEERAKFQTLTANIKISKECLTKPAYVDTNSKATKNRKVNQMTSSSRETAPLNHGIAGNSGSQNATKSKDSNQIRKRSKKSNDDPDWTPTTWYKTWYKKSRDPKPSKPPIKKTVDMLRYDRAKALEKEKESWKKRPW